MWQLLAKPLLGVVTDSVKGFVETKKLKSEVKIAQIAAEKKKNEDIATGKIKWEQSAVDQMKGSWKDEFVLLALMIPAICSFIGPLRPHIAEGFEVLSNLPEYYTHLLYLACSVSLGVRAVPGIKGMISKKKQYMDPLELIEQLNKILKNNKRTVKDVVLTGGATDYTNYMYLMGQLKSLDNVEQEYKEFLQKRRIQVE